MTGAQFDAIIAVAGRKGPAYPAARLVIIEGVGTTAAALQTGCSRQSCHKATKWVVECHSIIEAAYPAKRLTFFRKALRPDFTRP